jgi:amino acid adenylation domain-containing protein
MTTKTSSVLPPPGLSNSKKSLLDQRLRAARQQERAPAIPRRADPKRAPLSFAQQRLWFLDQLQPNSPMYNMPTPVRVRGPLDLGAFERSVNATVARHEMLRTRFIALEGEAVQEIMPPRPLKIDVVDLREIPSHQRETELNTRVRETARQPFDISKDLLVRVTLFQLAPEDHAIMINMHHIASDAWSFGVFFEELKAFYDHFTKGDALKLAELPIQYGDFSTWQRATLSSNALREQADYWRKKLAGAPELLELPTDHPRPAVQTFRGAHELLPLPAGLVGELRKLAQQNRATLFMLLLAAFKTLLHRYCGQQELLIGSPIAGRTQIETEALIGFFINTLVLRTDFSGDPTFLEVLDRVRTTTLEAYAHQEMPFDKLVEELHPERTSSYSPLIQAMFVLQNAPAPALNLGAATLEYIDVDTSTSKFDIVLSMEEAKGTLVADLEYNADLFEPATVKRLLQSFIVLLGGIVASPRQRVSELPVMTQAEHELIVSWNETEREYPREASVAELFERAAAKTPDAIAVIDGATEYTYGELNARANQLARHLQKLGVRTGTPVAVYLERGLSMIVTFLGILKAGGAYVPLDRSYPKDRITFMIEDTEAPVLITTTALREALPATRATLRCLDAAQRDIAAEPKENFATGARGDTLAYIIYTSGSTGRPKGVCVPHRAISRLVLNVDYAQLTPADVMAQVSNCSFDAATWEIWGSLLNGARLVIIPAEVLLTVRDFAGALARHEITAMFITTALFNQIAAEAPTAFRKMRHLLFGGEAADPKWAAEVLRQGAPERLLNVYGPTETTTFATWFHIQQVREGAQSIPIGRPIANTTAWVLDKKLNPAPIGVPGELYIGGDGVALGYWKRPELTEEKFITHPEWGRLYRTGDLVKRLPSGEIDFVGRIDQQVKIRGFRVEPGEIENVLSKHPGVSQCVVIARKDAAGSKQLVGYFAPKQTPGPTGEELRAFLNAKLPDYMVPAFLISVAHLPLSVNGKVDRKALPEPENLRAVGDQTRIAPRDPMEQQLQQIWQNVLAVSPIGMQDRFFDLGGHSLLALRLIAQIEKKMGRKLPVTAVFQSQTIEQLASVLREQGAWTPVSSLVEIQRGGKRPPLVLVHGVGGGMFWGYSNLAHHLDPEQPVFAFKSRGMDGQEELATIEELAVQYVTDLRKFQPHGPYYLGGYCFGGVVAYEMARRLRADGEEVALVALLNSCPPNSSYTRVQVGPQFAWRFLVNLGEWFVNALKWTRDQRRGFLRWKWRLIRKRLPGTTTADHGGIDEWVDLSLFPEDQKKLWETHIRALMKYHPKPYSGQVTLFRSRAHQLMSSYDPQYGWGEFAKGGVTVKVVPGAHESIVEEPNVKHLARELGSILAAAQKKGPTYPELFREQTRKTPDRMAVRHHDQELTYAELDRRSDLVAGFLRGAGIGPESIVGIALPRSIDFAVAVLGVMKAGGAYLPLDLSHPAERLAYYISDSGAKLVLAVNQQFPSSTAKVVPFAKASAGPLGDGTAAGPENIAYIMYTSGSTGAPKGVQITHASLLNHNLAVMEAFQLGPEDRVLQFASLNFDLSVEEMFPIWLRGGTLVFRPDEITSASIATFVQFVAHEKITVLDLPTAYWHELVDACKGKFLPECVRLVVIGGEQATFDRLKVWMHDVRHQARLINTYGPTETTVTATMYEAAPECLENGTFPIGKPIANTYAYVLDEKLQRVEPGLVGELCIGGAGVARGYLNRPELTKEKFIAHPEFGRLYRTGDLVRELADGNLEYQGRVDNQLKIRGFRVEPGEIEAVMRQHPAIKDAVVTPRQGRLVGYYLLRARGQRLDLAEFLRHKLPDYMVPAALVALDSFPLTPNGKVDRKALPAPEFARPDLDVPFIAPATDIEKKVAAIWCDVLGLDRVGTQDNFFHLGGHSLQAMQIISRMECELGLDVSVKGFFDEPTVAALAVIPQKPRPLNRSFEEHQGPLRLSFAQQRLWFLDQFQPNSAVYNIPQPIRLKGALRIDVLCQALDEIVRRHEVLRTTYPTVADSPVQQINPPRPVTLRNIDLQPLPAAERELSLHRQLVAEAQTPFNLREDLMLRALLVQLEPAENVLLLTIHHIAADAWSLGVILNELATLYNCFSKGQPSPLPELPAQYRHFAVQQRAQADELAQQLGYWKEQLAHAPSLFEWPADNPRPAVQSHRGGSHRFIIPREVAERLQALAQKERCTSFMTLLAAFQTLAYRYTGREDIVTGSAIANRSRPEFEPLVGFFVNTLPLRTRLAPGITFRQLLKRVRLVTIGAYEHQDLPFDRLVEALQPERDTSYQPLIQTMFIQLNVPIPDIPGSGITWLPFELDFGQSRFDLTLEMNQTAKGLEGRIEYATDLFAAATIARMAAQYQKLLESILQNPDSQLCELSILPEAEQQRVLIDWNNTDLEVPHRCLHALFEEQVRQAPAALAVIKGNDRLTYEELNARADAVAAKLQQLGAGPEKLIGICLERSLGLVSGILGILKSGAAYVPLDPSYPKERLEFMLSDSKAHLVLTERKLADRFAENAICVEDIERGRTADPARQAQPDNLAYVIYTSGSTGRPKGVAVEHRSAVNLVAWARNVYRPEELDGVLASTSVCFDLSVFELFVPLCLGGKIVLAENALELPSLPAAGEVRLVNTVPSAMAQLLELRGIPESVHVINLAGEPLTRQLADRIYSETKVQKLYDLYGPTEDTVYATFALRQPGGPETIGRPVSNNRPYILSPHGQPVPIGVPGELFIGGGALARGYIERPDLTAERFLPDPFSDKPAARMYRTGDLARFLADGNLEFLGRIDHQVKIRGFRIELGEIEETLREHPKVREAVVMAKPDRTGDKRLAAYVTARNGEPPRPHELTDWLNEKLPDYMVPRLYTVLDRFPLTANGKIDRKALPDPEIGRDAETAFAEPSTEIEKLLARIWCEVLELQTVGVNDNFFKLGGHSLKITQIISRVREALEIELPMRAVFEAPTIASLALRIEELLIEELNALSEEEAQRLNGPTE